MHLRRAALAAAAILGAGACGGGGSGAEEAGRSDAGTSTSSVASGSPTTEASPPAGAPADIDVPDASLIDVGSGEEVSLRSLVPSERPILFWFWAPH